MGNVGFSHRWPQHRGFHNLATYNEFVKTLFGPLNALSRLKICHNIKTARDRNQLYLCMCNAMYSAEGNNCLVILWAADWSRGAIDDWRVSKHIVSRMAGHELQVGLVWLQWWGAWIARLQWWDSKPNRLVYIDAFGMMLEWCWLLSQCLTW